MSEKNKGHDAGAPPLAVAVDPAAVALAFAGASREKADAFLDDQCSLIADQRHHLLEQFKHLRLITLERRLGAALLMATAVIGIAIASGFGFMIWKASQANGLVIESFSVPPDIAGRGLSGQVVAGQFLDKLTDMHSKTRSSRGGKSYTSNWGESLKVEIPETGISVGEAYRFLVELLGHETHVTGVVYRTATGIAVTARTGSGVGEPFIGAEGDLDNLLQKSAEYIYGQTQPLRYAALLRQQGKLNQSREILNKLVRSGSPVERAYAYNSLFIIQNTVHFDMTNLSILQKGLELDPGNPILNENLANTDFDLGRTEQSLPRVKRNIFTFADDDHGGVSPENAPPLIKKNRATVASYLGDFHEAVFLQTNIVDDGGLVGSSGVSSVLAAYEAGEHNITAALNTIKNPIVDSRGDEFLISLLITQITVDIQAQDWSAADADQKLFDKLLITPNLQRRYSTPLAISAFASISANLGDLDGAEKLISPTQGDCYPCMITRAQIADMRHQYARADWWFSKATAIGPSIPMAEASWGKSYLARGKPDDAIAQFTISNKKGPHFADPLEGWGEALMAKNQSHLALAKFAEAEKYAPKWGRLHMKWGEALTYAGQPEKAKAQYALAAGLDLTPGEKVELAHLTRRGS